MIYGLVSVVIPCRNEVNHIENCVHAIYRSSYPNIEVIVVDGMSDDGTRDVLARLSEIYSTFSFYDNIELLTPYAFNTGILRSKGEYIQIVGARNQVDEEYIEKLVEVLESKAEVACVGGDYQHIADTESSRWVCYAMESWFGVGSYNYRVRSQDCYVDTVGVPLFRKEIFEKIGLFDNNLTRNQDDDFSFRLKKKGYKIYYRHDAKVSYVVRSSLQKLARQYYQYGYFKVLVGKKHKTLTSLRQVVPLLFFLFVFIFPAIAILNRKILSVYFLVLAIYFFLGFFSAAPTSLSWYERLKVQRAILVIHWSYARGYAKGLLDFCILRREPELEHQQMTT